jgi:hypothetical protein
MGIVSCYTTAVGLYPMLGNWVLSYATAFALSVFMVAIALRIPKAYEEGTQGRMIAGYIFVALFSVLLNFNAIYGVFSAEKLINEELKENKTELTAIQTRAVEALDSHFGAVETERKLQEARALLKEETTNNVDPGYGEKAREINKDLVIPLQAKLVEIRTKYNPTVRRIDSVVSAAQATTHQALEAKDITLYREAVDRSIDAHSQVGEMTQNLVGEDQFSYEPMTFQHRDVGNLNHSLWTVANLHRLEAKQASSVIVSLLLSFLIDFIVLFVLVMINRPGKGDLNQEEQAEGEEADERLPWQQGDAGTRRGNIYASRRRRKSDEKSASLNRHQVQRVGWNKPQPEPAPKRETITPIQSDEAPTDAQAPVPPAADTAPEKRQPESQPEPPATERQPDRSEERLALPAPRNQASDEADHSPDDPNLGDGARFHQSDEPPKWYLPGEEDPGPISPETDEAGEARRPVEVQRSSDPAREELRAERERRRRQRFNGKKVTLPGG